MRRAAIPTTLPKFLLATLLPTLFITVQLLTPQVFAQLNEQISEQPSTITDTQSEAIAIDTVTKQKQIITEENNKWNLSPAERVLRGLLFYYERDPIVVIQIVRATRSKKVLESTAFFTVDFYYVKLIAGVPTTCSGVAEFPIKASEVNDHAPQGEIRNLRCK